MDFGKKKNKKLILNIINNSITSSSVNKINIVNILEKLLKI